jgi:competence protein ComGC
MSEIVKQEGDFKISKPRKPKSLNTESKVTKVDLSVNRAEPEVTKVVIPNLNTDTDAIQKQSTDESMLRSEQSEVGLYEMEQRNEGSSEDVIQEITDEEVKEEAIIIEAQAEKHIQEQINTGKPLPENIEKLVTFMEETGGSVEDYVRLSTDYSSINNEVLIKEYYKKSRPHLDLEEIEFLMEDKFSYDEDEDDERDIKKKKLAFKEEVAKARNFLEDLKGKYYDEIKLRPGVTKEQQEASDFFNRYKKNEDESKTRHDRFKQDTKSLFTNDFKGFEYNVGEKRFRYTVQNNEQVAEKQSDINNFLGKFLDKEGNINDTKGYHKALYSAMNSDKIAQHFYEQGKADAIKEVVTNSKNPGAAQPRQTSGEVFINGLKVKSISGFDSSKLRIQTKKFNN